MNTSTARFHNSEEMTQYNKTIFTHCLIVFITRLLNQSHKPGPPMLPWNGFSLVPPQLVSKSTKPVIRKSVTICNIKISMEVVGKGSTQDYTAIEATEYTTLSYHWYTSISTRLPGLLTYLSLFQKTCVHRVNSAALWCL